NEARPHFWPLTKNVLDYGGTPRFWPQSKEPVQKRRHDGYGSVTHLFGNIDDVSSDVPLVDLEFFHQNFERLANRPNLHFNRIKSHILASCDGESAIPRLAAVDVVLAAEVQSATSDPNVFEPVELVSGFRLLGSLVGSQDFAREFFAEKIAATTKNADALDAGFADLQTRLLIFKQCTIQQLPHLLGAEVMHFLPLNFDGADWICWNGPLVAEINELIENFLTTLIGGPEVPDYAMSIAQIGINGGGLGLLNASNQAAPDFVLTMAAAMRYAQGGFRSQGLGAHPTPPISQRPLQPCYERGLHQPRTVRLVGCPHRGLGSVGKVPSGRPPNALLREGIEQQCTQQAETTLQCHAGGNTLQPRWPQVPDEPPSPAQRPLSSNISMPGRHEPQHP
ncbi:hypothetical protein ACHAXR_001239, partial [Thalassiosira sp. AJA248-18]